MVYRSFVDLGSAPIVMIMSWLFQTDVDRSGCTNRVVLMNPLRLSSYAVGSWISLFSIVYTSRVMSPQAKRNPFIRYIASGVIFDDWLGTADVCVITAGIGAREFPCLLALMLNSCVSLAQYTNFAQSSLLQFSSNTIRQICSNGESGVSKVLGAKPSYTKHKGMCQRYRKPVSINKSGRCCCNAGQ